MAVDDPVIIGWQSNKFLKQATSKALTLYLNTGFLNDNNYTSFYSAGSSSVYEVPASKKFIILQITFQGASDATGQKNVQLGYSTTQDSATGFNKVQHWQALITQPFTYETYIEVSAGNYITGVGEANSANLILSGVECDA